VALESEKCVMSEQGSPLGRPHTLRPAGVRRWHIIFTATVIALAALLLYTCLTTLRYRGEFGPGPGFVPTWASLILLITGIWLHVLSWRGKYSGGGKTVELNPTPGLAFLGTMVASVLLIPVLGLLGSLALFFLVGAIWIERCPVWQGLLVGVVITVSMYLLFRLMKVPIPSGVFGLLFN